MGWVSDDSARRGRNNNIRFVRGGFRRHSSPPPPAPPDSQHGTHQLIARALAAAGIFTAGLLTGRYVVPHRDWDSGTSFQEGDTAGGILRHASPVEVSSMSKISAPSFSAAPPVPEARPERPASAAQAAAPPAAAADVSIRVREPAQAGALDTTVKALFGRPASPPPPGEASAAGREGLQGSAAENATSLRAVTAKAPADGASASQPPSPAPAPSPFSILAARPAPAPSGPLLLSVSVQNSANASGIIGDRCFVKISGPFSAFSPQKVNIALAMLPWRVVRSVVATTGSEASSLSELQRVPGRATQTDTSELRLAIEGCLREAGVEQAGGIFSPFTPYQE